VAVSTESAVFLENFLHPAYYYLIFFIEQYFLLIVAGWKWFCSGTREGRTGENQLIQVCLENGWMWWKVS